MEKLKPSYKEAVENGEESAIESNDFDYAQIMNVSNSTSESMPTPREILQEGTSRVHLRPINPIYRL